MPGILLAFFLLVGGGMFGSLTDSTAPIYGRLDRSSHSAGKVSRKPEVFIRLGQAYQICASPGGETTVDVFVNLINLPAQEVRFLVDRRTEAKSTGQAAHLIITRAGVGQHQVDVVVGSIPRTITFSVWLCDPLPERDQNLYDAQGLRGYLPEKSCPICPECPTDAG